MNDDESYTRRDVYNVNNERFLYVVSFVFFPSDIISLRAANINAGNWPRTSVLEQLQALLQHLSTCKLVKIVSKKLKTAFIGIRVRTVQQRLLYFFPAVNDKC